jgi:hypothetical protein
VLFAKRLSDFGPPGRKAVRVIVYEGQGRIKTLKEHVEPIGYAAGFETLLTFIHGLVPSNEVIGQALRKSVPMYPELAVRELVANALIHQDLFVTGAGPMVEIFDGRIEFTNPGEPLVATDRFVDAPPRSRNEALASLMRRMGICEERGPTGLGRLEDGDGLEGGWAELPDPLAKGALVKSEITRHLAEGLSSAGAVDDLGDEGLLLIEGPGTPADSGHPGPLRRPPGLVRTGHGECVP